MAVSHNVSNTVSNKYNTEADGIEFKLPSGGCNWTNLSLGVNAARCGCKRFWDRSVGSSSTHVPEKTGFCMCEHHACYHDHTPQKEQDADVLGGSTTPKQAPRAREIQNQIANHSFGPGSPLQQPAFPDSVQWSRFLQDSPQGLPAIPSQCLLPSDNGSTTSGSQSGHSRPFGGRGLNTLVQVPRTSDNPAGKSLGPRMQIYEDRHGVQHLQSLTDGATPSVRSQEHNVDLVDHAASVGKKLETILESQGSRTSVSLVTSQEPAQILEQRSFQATDPADDNRNIPLVVHEQRLREPNDLPARIANHEHRLDQLENVSFTHPAIDDLHEDVENMDLRVSSLETRFDDFHQAQEAREAASMRQSIEQSFASDTSSAMIVAAIDHIDSSRVEALEAQVVELQAIAPPSYSRPWEVEVVFLPFGTRLMGIWSSQDSMTPRSRLGSIANDDWTQTQSKSMALGHARLAAHDGPTTWETSATNLAEQELSWVMARACGVGSRVDHRLKSRGLVKTIQVCGPDARDVQSAMLSAFGDLPDILAQDPFASQDENLGEIPKSLRGSLGLQASWVPLRKLHKDSCLRFLNPAEMITPALWTVQFLSSSVAMRHAGTRRLYVTQRDSYIQQHTESGADWTWQKLRQLPRVYPEQSSVSHTPEADAQEECWAHDPRLDPPLVSSSFNSSFHSQISQLSIDSLPPSPNPSYEADQTSLSGESPTASTPRTSMPPTIPLSPLRQRNPIRPLHRRTISMSSIIPIKGDVSSQNLTSKRRIASFDREREVQSSPILISLEVAKRRRISRSPSRPLQTPGWSVGSPSPFPMDVESKRGTTPFAYATPHSNAPYIPRSGADGDVYVYEDGDDDEEEDYYHEDDDDKESTTDADEEEGYEHNALSDYERQRESKSDDDEWQGVQDDAVTYEPRQIEEDAESEVSDSPSEYPSTQQHQQVEQQQQVKPAVGTGLLYERRQKREMGFRIHVDEEVEGA